MSRLRVACLVLCVVLAGCSGLTGTGTDTGTTTATPDDETYLQQQELAAGLSAGGIENASDLMEAHRSNVRSTGASTHLQVATEREDSTSRANVTVAYGSDGSMLFNRSTAYQDSRVGVAFYTDGDRSFVERKLQKTVYSAVDGTAAVETRGSRVGVQVYMSLAEFEVTSVDRQAETLTLSVVGGNNDSALFGPEVTVENATGSAVVGTNGTVHELTLSFDLGLDSASSTIRVDYDVDALGKESVTEPDWVDTAREEATEIDLSVSRDGDAVRVSNDGDQTLPRGAQVVVTTRESPQSVTESFAARLQSPLDPGQTVTLYQPEPGTTRSELERGSVTPDDPAPLSGTVVVQVVAADGEMLAYVTLDADE